MVIAYPLDHAQAFRVFGRDDATLLYQSGLNVGVVAMGEDGRPYSTEVPIYRLQLAFGKRAGAERSARLAPSPREEDCRPQQIADAFKAFADAMAGNEDRSPCA